MFPIANAIHGTFFSVSQERANYQVGDVVEALWPVNGRWYQAIVQRKMPAGIIVRYAADSVTRTLRAHQIRVRTFTRISHPLSYLVVSNVIDLMF